MNVTLASGRCPYHALQCIYVSRFVYPSKRWWLPESILQSMDLSASQMGSHVFYRLNTHYLSWRWTWRMTWRLIIKRKTKNILRLNLQILIMIHLPSKIDVGQLMSIANVRRTGIRLFACCSYGRGGFSTPQLLRDGRHQVSIAPDGKLDNEW